MDDKASPSLADPGRGDGEVVECILEDGVVGFLTYAQMLGRSGGGEVIRGCDVCQDKRGVGNVGMVGDGFVDDQEGMVCGFFLVVRCRCQAKDDQSVCRRVGLREDCLLPGLLLALHLHELLCLHLLCHLCVGGCSALGGFGGVCSWSWALLGGCWCSSGGWWVSGGGETWG